METSPRSGHFLPPFDFDRLTESDIREEVVAPVLAMLGYRSGTVNNVMRERSISLRYPKLSLGRKKSGKDVVLIGRPDYLCEVRNVTRWVLEAKPPCKEIAEEDVEQAHSYAFHHEIAAPLFVLCNGRRWIIFETCRGPGSSPVLDISYDELRSNFHLLGNFLSPPALNRRFPAQVVDLERPLSANFGSRAKIVGGFTRYDEIESEIVGWPSHFPVPNLGGMKKLVGFRAAIIGDDCRRACADGIVANVRMHYQHETLQTVAEQLGLGTNRYVTRDEEISQDPDAPNIFEFLHETTIPAGTEALDVTQLAPIRTLVNIKCTWYAEAIGHLDGDVFRGVYSARLFSNPQYPGLNVEQWTFMRGSYEVFLQAV